jgi:hypothetical protein
MEEARRIELKNLEEQLLSLGLTTFTLNMVLRASVAYGYSTLSDIKRAVESGECRAWRNIGLKRHLELAKAFKYVDTMYMKNDEFQTGYLAGWTSAISGLKFGQIFDVVSALDDTIEEAEWK